MNLLAKKDVNTLRQFEFDMAKAICILGMVFVHCFEELTVESAAGTSSLFYIFVIVLDSIFGASTFMMCMGLGISYSFKGDANKLIVRGAKIFAFGYILNIFREGLLAILGVTIVGLPITYAIVLLICDDIMQFAGLALMLFGLLKKLKFSDFAIFIVALIMSVVGSFIRFVDPVNPVLVQIYGLLIGTCSATNELNLAPFPLLNWFIVVVVGYLYGKYIIRRCTDIDKYYKLALPISGVLLATYMGIAIPRELGMMNPNILYYYQFTTPNILVFLLGMIFATSLYHYASKIIPKAGKNLITTISKNINRTYCIHWVIIGLIEAIFAIVEFDGLAVPFTFIVGTIIFVVANIIAEEYTRFRKRKLEEKRVEVNDGNNQNS